MVNRNILFVVTVIAILTLSVAGVWADEDIEDETNGSMVLAASAVARNMSYQGRLLDNGGSPVTDTVTMGFRLYDDPAAGTLVWGPQSKSVTVTDGLFNTELSSLNVGDFRQALWLEIEIGGSGTLSPRQQLMGAPYAFSLVPGAMVLGSLGRRSLLTVNNTAFHGGIEGRSCGGDGVRGISYGGGGSADNGVYGETNSDQSTHAGVYGKSTGDAAGGRFISEGGVGVYGETDSTQSTDAGVYGRSTSNAAGGYFISYEGDGVTAYSTTDDGVYAHSVYGRGVYAGSSYGTGVRGYGGSGPDDYGGYFTGWRGLYAKSGSSNYAAYLDGDISVQGDIYKTGSVAFVEDHPTDPTKEIVYVCLEGGETGTYTRGSAQLENGVATVELPEDFRLVTSSEGITVQVTPTGDCKGIYVSEKSNSTIVVAELGNGKSDATFDYLVNGIRIGYEDYQPIQDKDEERRDPGVAAERIAEEDEPFISPEPSPVVREPALEPALPPDEPARE